MAWAVKRRCFGYTLTAVSVLDDGYGAGKDVVNDKHGIALEMLLTLKSLMEQKKNAIRSAR